MPSERRLRKVEILGVTMEAWTRAELTDRVAEAARRGERIVVANHNVNSVYLHHRVDAMRRFYAAADVVHIDGMALVFAARLAGYPVRRRHRVTYVDWIDPLLSMAGREGLRVFHLGGTPEVAAAGEAWMARRHPDVAFAAAHGYFDADPGSSDTRGRLDAIARFEPNILLVGMGMPRQEIWTLDNLAEIHANAILMAGACLDYKVGAVKTPPRWLGRLGFEWLYRLVQEPGRLTRRYLVQPWSLTPWLLRDLRGRARAQRLGREW